MSSKPIAWLGLLILLTASVQACGTSAWSKRDTNPSIQDQIYLSNWWVRNFGNPKSFSTFSTTASRRMVIVGENPHGKGDVFACSEPPPDVGEAFASAVSDGFKIAAQDPKSGITADFANQYARAAATQIAPLLYRTQGLQMYRDGLHSLCIDKMNRWLDGDDQNDADGKKDSHKDAAHKGDAHKEYLAQKRYLLDKALELIKLELPLMEKAQEIFYQNAKAGFAIGDLQKIAELLKSSATTTTPPSGPNTPPPPSTSPSGPRLPGHHEPKHRGLTRKG